jgi:hypothetical protein
VVASTIGRATPMLRAVLDTSLVKNCLCIGLPGLVKSAIFEAPVPGRFLFATPDSDRDNASLQYVAMGQFRTHALKQRQLYSITSSARPLSASGTAAHQFIYATHASELAAERANAFAASASEAFSARRS